MIILVQVTTDHKDPQQAVESLKTVMERAGYNFVDKFVWGDRLPHEVETMTSGIVQVIEPEIDPRANGDR